MLIFFNDYRKGYYSTKLQARIILILDFADCVPPPQALDSQT